MARINLETKLWGEFEFQELLIKVGDRHKAKGMVTELFTLAQEYWFPDMKLIPKSKIESFGLQLCIDAGLAEERESGVYVIGSKDAFAWLFQKQDAGKQSGEARRNKKPKKTRERPLTPVERPSTPGNGSERERTSLLSSPSPSSLFFIPDPSSLVGKTDVSPPDDGVEDRRKIWEAYSEAYEEQHGAAPVRNKKTNSLIKRFSELVPIEEAPKIASFYVQSKNAFYFQKGHPLELLLADSQKLRTEWVTGRRITQTKSREGDRAEANREVVRDYLEETGGL